MKWLETTLTLLIVLVLIAVIAGLCLFFVWLETIIGWVSYLLLGIIFCAGMWLIIYHTIN